MDIYNYLHEYTYYKEGRLYWLKPPRQGVSKDSLVGKERINNKGYRMAMIKGKYWLIHRLIYIYHFKEIKEVIDHIDRNKLNNNIENLRDVSRSINQSNIGIPSHNTSGYKGVSFYKSRNKWVAEIRVNKKKHWIGSFATEQEAHEAYMKELVNVGQHNL
jgi:hypothetical protein